jgi:hypothetical protein
LIRYAPENLILRSEEFDNAYYGKASTGVSAATVSANNDTAPDGTTTADLVGFSATTATNQEGQLFRNVLAPSVGVAYTLSVYMRVPSGTATVYIGLTESIPSLAGNFVACNVTTTWQRFSVTRTATGSSAIFAEIGPDTRSFTGQPNVQAAASVLLWGAQVERHTSARTYIPTTTAAVYGARFDHDPVTLACKGLLIEESRTNLTIRSDDFGASEWNASLQGNLTVTANNTASPSGATDADLLTVGSTTTIYQVLQRLPAITGSVTSGTTYTVSAFFKANQVTRVSLWAGNTVTLPVDAIFDLTGSGSVVVTSAGTASIQQVGNGWYRCSVTGTAGATSDTTLRIGPASGTSRTYVGNSVDSFWAWGAQLEAGSFPTSYIPTTTASVVRSADVCSYSSVSSFYNPVEGTLVSDVIVNVPAPSVAPEIFRFGSGNDRIQLGSTNVAGSGIRPFIINGGTTTYSSTQGTATTGVSRKVAIAFKTDDAISSFNGTLGTQDTSVIIPTSISAATIGGSFVGHIISIRYYKKRVSNSRLQSITT